MKSYDVAVVGLGVVGCSALHALSLRAIKAVGIDRFAPPHVNGSSHGESRITREAIGEGYQYVPLAIRSNHILEELEQRTDTTLLVRCGFLIIEAAGAGTQCHGKPGFMAASMAAAQANSIAHEVLHAEEVRYRYPQFSRLDGSEQAYFEPGGGYVCPDAIISAMLTDACRHGATIRADCMVVTIEPDVTGFKIVTNDGLITAQSVILATGPWINELSATLARPRIKIYRQVLHWFPMQDKRSYQRDAQPTFYWMHGPNPEDQFYGFPPIEGFVKVAIEQYANPIDPEQINRDVSPEEQLHIANKHVIGRLNGLAHLPARSKTCIYSVNPNFDFLIGEEIPGLHVVSACSGHGFKHAPAVGEAVALKALGMAGHADLSPFLPR